jgi:DNA-binding NarL/FixJ family response regulator
VESFWALAEVMKPTSSMANVLDVILFMLYLQSMFFIYILDDVVKPKSRRRRPLMRTIEGLSPHELQVLNELVKGRASKQIADVLNITENTTKGYLKNIPAKLHVADRTEAVTVAIQRGIIHF